MNKPIINSPGYEIPEKTILIVPEKHVSNSQISSLVQPLTEIKTREWFNPMFYYCLPLAIGNQYGFIVKAQESFTVFWDGESHKGSVKVSYEKSGKQIQKYSSHFGEGIVTIQNYWHFRTPPGVNLMTITPPNFIQHGLLHMTGVIETDNLRRDFTFNIRITKPNIKITINKGDPIGAFIPIPRWYADQFKLAFANEIYNQNAIDLEHEVGQEFNRQRRSDDKQKPKNAGRRYFRGEDAWGNKFLDHQKH